MNNDSGAVIGMNPDYNANCSPQYSAIEASIPDIYRSIEVFDSISNDSPVIISDYGSSHGRNSVYVIKKIIDYARITEKIGKDQQVLVVHNDLPTNDWNTLFGIVGKEDSYYSVASGKSFYDQVLPNNSVSIGYSSTALHWLSKKPCNISEHCHPLFIQNDSEKTAFKSQAMLDYDQFLSHRSREIKSGGILVLTIVALNDKDEGVNMYGKNLLYQCAQQFLTNEELLDYTLPIYYRSYVESVDQNLFAKHSFEIINISSHDIKSSLFVQWQQGKLTLDQLAEARTGYMRSWSNSILTQVLSTHGRSSEAIEKISFEFWALYEDELRRKMYDDETQALAQEHSTDFNEICVCLKKK